MPDLSVLIPARNEEWLAQTVADVLAHLRGDTEIIVVLDGQWATPPLPQHPRLQVVYLPVAIGQRAATNLAARISTAPYIMKLDAHCGVAEGFDVELLRAAADLGDDVTQIPAQFNLHVYDWVCACGERVYQGPQPKTCLCGEPRHVKAIVWQPRRRRRTTAWRFDGDLHFQYWGEFERSARGQGEITETMSCLGACWFMSRAHYWALGGLDEAHGSWGQMGTELACKAWLSGGRMVTNQRTWFSHLFRTQPGFGFPYPISTQDQDRARAYSQALWRGGQWPHQVRPLSWLVEHFAPVPGWLVPAPRSAATTAGIVTYTDSQLDPVIDRACRQQLRRAADGLPIMRVALGELKPVGDRPPRDPAAPKRVRASRDQSGHIVLPLERGYLTMFRQILKGLEALDVDVVFFAEHDVLYAPEHLTYRPSSARIYAYNTHVWKVDAVTGRALHYRCEQTSGLCADRQLLLDHYRRRVAHVEAHGFNRRLGFEPGKSLRHGGLDDIPRETWFAARPNVDIRHRGNLTPSRWRKDEFRDQRYTAGWTEADEIPGWGRTAGRFDAWLHEVTTCRR